MRRDQSGLGIVWMRSELLLDVNITPYERKYTIYLCNADPTVTTYVQALSRIGKEKDTPAPYRSDDKSGTPTSTISTALFHA